MAKLDLHQRLEHRLAALGSEVRDRAAEAIRQLGDASTPLTVEGLADRFLDRQCDLDLRLKAVWVAGLTGDTAFEPALRKVIESSPPTGLLWEAAKSCGNLAVASDLFRRLVREAPDAETRQVAAHALGHLQERSASSELCKAVADREEAAAVRAEAAESLGYIRDRVSLPTLLAAARDPEPEVRFWAAFALGNLGDPQARPVLKELAASDTAVVEGWWEVSREARAALEELEKDG